MEIDAVGEWQGGAPPWLDAVFEGDLLGAGEEALPVWGRVETSSAWEGDELPVAAERAPAVGSAAGGAWGGGGPARAVGAGGRFARGGGVLGTGQLSNYKTRLLVEELELFDPVIAEAVQDRVLGPAGAPGEVTG